MTNISVYVVVNLTIIDADEYRIYEKGFFPLLKNIMEHLLHLMIPQKCLKDQDHCLEGQLYFLFQVKKMRIIGGMMWIIKN